MQGTMRYRFYARFSPDNAQASRVEILEAQTDSELIARMMFAHWQGSSRYCYVTDEESQVYVLTSRNGCMV